MQCLTDLRLRLTPALAAVTGASTKLLLLPEIEWLGAAAALAADYPRDTGYRLCDGSGPSRRA